MTDNQTTLDVRNHAGAHMGDEPSGTSPSALALTCDRIRVASRSYAMVTVPDLGIVTIVNSPSVPNYPFSWIERFTADPDGPAGPAFVVGNVDALADAIARAAA